MATEQTLRQAIEAGERGGFPLPMVALYDAQYPQLADIRRLMLASSDERRRQALVQATQQACGAGVSWRQACENSFPYLAHLDEPASDWPTCEVASDGN